jgi:hypothetical protein
MKLTRRGPTTESVEAITMDIRLSYVTALTLALFPACGGNDLDVGTIDAASITPASTGGSGGSGGAYAGGGAGGSGGSIVDALLYVDPDTSKPTCDPFAAMPKPIALGTVLGAGQSADGTLYVADQFNSLQRVFVSDATGTLVRRRVSGSGFSSNGSGLNLYDFSSEGPDGQFVLQIEKPAAGPVRMGVVQGTLTDRKSFTIGQDGEELTVLPTGSTATMPVRNLPGDVTVEYIATSSLGEQLVVTRPTDDWSYTDFRLFLGPAGVLNEYPVTNVMRATDGGSTTITFTYDYSPSATAVFPVITVISDGGSPGFAPGPATLATYGTTRSLTRESTLPSAIYYCL